MPSPRPDAVESDVLTPAFKLRLHPLDEPAGAAAEAPGAPGAPDPPLPAEAAGIADKAALRLLRHAAGLEPNDADYHYILGLGLARARRHTEAAAAFREALSLHHSEPDYYYAYGTALWEVGYDEEAGDAFREVLRLRPDDPRALNGLACALTRGGREAEAIALFHEAQSHRRTDADVTGNLAIALWRTGKTDAALKALRLAVRGQPKSPFWRRQLALALSGTGHHDDAVAELQRVVRQQPQDVGVLLDLATELFEARRFDQAEHALGEALKLDSEAAASRPRVQEIRAALTLMRLRAELRPARASIAPRVVGAIGDGLSALTLPRHLGSALLVAAIASLCFLAYRLGPPYVTRYLLQDDVAAVAIAPVDKDEDVVDRLRHAVRERGMEAYVTDDSCQVHTRPKWRRIVCRYEVPVDILPGVRRTLRFHIDVEKPYLTQPETLHF